MFWLVITIVFYLSCIHSGTTNATNKKGNKNDDDNNENNNDNDDGKNHDDKGMLATNTNSVVPNNNNILSFFRHSFVYSLYLKYNLAFVPSFRRTVSRFGGLDYDSSSDSNNTNDDYYIN
jgi:hypothetical protein